MGEGYQGWSCHQAWELNLAITNDEPLMNKQLFGAWKLNFERKMKRGVYNHELAVKGIRDNFIPQAITRLHKLGYLEYPRYPIQIKQEVAKALVRSVEEDIEYSKSHPK